MHIRVHSLRADNTPEKGGEIRDNFVASTELYTLPPLEFSFKSSMSFVVIYGYL